jgi:uncharacterized protein (DUF1684 family)
MSLDLAAFRRRKDEFFGADSHSPLSPEQREVFTGLSYYPENPALRFEIEIAPLAEQVEVQMPTSSGEAKTFIRFGYFHFEVDGQLLRLTVYAPPGGVGGMFVPFADATSGHETYEGGRYLDIVPLAGSTFTADFNLAYNPYCAYREPPSLAARAGRSPQEWVCPIPPPENRLSVPIRAGEKMPVGDWVEGG